MPIYTQETTLRVAKRYNNTKRPYLLVNPLQAKHLPVSPSEALSMMKSLGHLLCQKYPNTKLVIGFAETATAIGAAVATCFPDPCIYIHTTRESMPDVQNWVLFSEEHSHAVEQKLCAETLGVWFHLSDTILFVEDEISTGKTLINMVQKLKQQFPVLSEKKLVAASILNRVSPENITKMEDAGIQCEYLVKLPQVDYSEMVSHIQVSEANPTEYIEPHLICETLSELELYDPRKGVNTKTYTQNCLQIAQEFCSHYTTSLPYGASVLVLGTEECMYPALILGDYLEQSDNHLSVRCHATTRSPIGISQMEGYPITSGHKIMSFYETERNTYLYNLQHYDAVIVVTDSLGTHIQAMGSFLSAIKPYHIPTLFWLQGGRHVWYI